MTANNRSPGTLILGRDRIPVWPLPRFFVDINGVGLLFTRSHLSRPISSQTARLVRLQIISVYSFFVILSAMSSRTRRRFVPQQSRMLEEVSPRRSNSLRAERIGCFVDDGAKGRTNAPAENRR
jgi:hypothetical protein